MKKISLVSFLFALAACSGEEAKQLPAAAATSRPPAQAQPAAQTPAMPKLAPPSGRLTGEVAETMNSGGYTYMLVKRGQSGQWVAVRETKVKVGQTVSIEPQLTMENFESSTLKRKFASIVFGTLAGDAPANQPPMISAMGSPREHMDGGAADVGQVRVDRAPGGRTIAEVWAARDLADKPVVVRGKVVKFRAGIMGTNWMHIRDGSGSEANGDHDLTVTTDDTAAAGDVVIVSGTLRRDKDFGAGYVYPVIVEKAKISK